MPQKPPSKTSFRVTVPDEYLPRIDEIVEEDKYGGRSEFVMRLIRDYIDEKDRQRALQLEYKIIEEKKKLKR
ncbi:CopG family ribbon-helix-helix protein [Candidatus Methanomassiliicoccus intestinalis]|uniref:CopG family ribbon-helix-helix protein n=1 Tax=Candidatus Methanomassiliicoccus intestinalis TaxID=1406512 RepID=UPI0037DDB537